MIVSLKEVLKKANENSRAVPCFNCFGFEDANAIVLAAEELKLPVILAVNKDMVDYMPMEAIISLLRSVCEKSSVEVVLHLDHTYDLDIIYRAIDLGFSSVMFDGSQLPIEENIESTNKVIDYAKRFHVSVEAEVGSVPYEVGRDHIKNELTKIEDVIYILNETKIDALAISVGNVHRKTEASVEIDYSLLNSIQKEIKDTALVIHGATGIYEEDLKKLKETKVAKFNIGTSLRKVFGEKLRELFYKYPNEFDRLFFMKKMTLPLKQKATYWLELLS